MYSIPQMHSNTGHFLGEFTGQTGPRDIVLEISVLVSNMWKTQLLFFILREERLSQIDYLLGPTWN